MGHSSFLPVVEYASPAVVTDPAASDPVQPKSSLENVQSNRVDPTTDPASPSDTEQGEAPQQGEAAQQGDATPATPAADPAGEATPPASDAGDLPQPALSGPDNTPTGFRISPFPYRDPNSI
jgi:hypothetical protein